MRVRPTLRRPPDRADRRPHDLRPAPPAQAPAPGLPRPRPGVAQADELADVRRMRASGGPDDTATYTCGCGAVFAAEVSTSVACPVCGGGQAW